MESDGLPSLLYLTVCRQVNAAASNNLFFRLDYCLTALRITQLSYHFFIIPLPDDSYKRAIYHGCF